MTTIDTHATGAAEPGAGLAGVADWLTTTDHKRIGRLYVGVSLVALVGSLVVAALLAAERISTSGTKACSQRLIGRSAAGPRM